MFATSDGHINIAAAGGRFRGVRDMSGYDPSPTPGQPDKQPMQVPVRIGLVGQTGAHLPLTLDRLHSWKSRA